MIIIIDKLKDNSGCKKYRVVQEIVLIQVVHDS